MLETNNLIVLDDLPISSFQIIFQWLAKAMSLTNANISIRNVLIKKLTYGILGHHYAPQ